MMNLSPWKEKQQRLENLQGCWADIPAQDWGLGGPTRTPPVHTQSRHLKWNFSGNRTWAWWWSSPSPATWLPLHAPLHTAPQWAQVPLSGTQRERWCFGTLNFMTDNDGEKSKVHLMNNCGIFLCVFTIIKQQDKLEHFQVQLTAIKWAHRPWCELWRLQDLQDNWPGLVHNHCGNQQHN